MFPDTGPGGADNAYMARPCASTTSGARRPLPLPPKATPAPAAGTKPGTGGKPAAPGGPGAQGETPAAPRARFIS